MTNTQNTYAVTLSDVCLPIRDRAGHKGNFGRNLIIGGSVGYSGAPCLAAGAAVRSGAGLVFLGVPEKIYIPAMVKCQTAMPFPLPCDSIGTISASASYEILMRLSACNVCLIGPGLGSSPGVSEVVYSLISAAKIPIVIDADGINAVSANIDILKSAKVPLVLTPHEGEFARLGGKMYKTRAESARAFSAEHGCITVLKGPGTATAFPDGQVFVNTTGNPGMAKGGSGDVLSGVITALIGQNLPLSSAVPWAVFLHGLAGDLCSARYTEYSMTPSDIIEALPSAFQKALSQKNI